MIKKRRRLFLLFLDEKKHTHSVFYEKTAQNCAKNILLRLKSFNSAAVLKDFHALIIYFLNANSVNVVERKDFFG